MPRYRGGPTVSVPHGGGGAGVHVVIPSELGIDRRALIPVARVLEPSGPRDGGKGSLAATNISALPLPETDEAKICRGLRRTSLALRSETFPCRLVWPSPDDGISGEPHANVSLYGSVRGDALPVRLRCNRLQGGAGKSPLGDTLQLGGW